MGFDTKDKWGSRSLEPGKCVISSLSLVRLKTEREKEKERQREKELNQQTPSDTPPDSPSLTPTTSHASGTTANANGERSRSRPRSRIAQLASSASRAASRSLSLKRNSSSAKADPNQTKLLLFWRKPARKCWWSHGWITINIDVADLKELEEDGSGGDTNGGSANGDGGDPAKLSVKVHVRRVWTLELSIIT